MISDHHFGLRIRFWAVVAITGMGYAQSAIACRAPGSGNSLVAFSVVGIVFTILCLTAQFWCERQGKLSYNLAYLAVQLGLVALLLAVSPVKGPGIFFLLPLLSHAMFVLPLRHVTWFGFLLLGIALLHLAIPGGWVDMLIYLPATLVSFVFTAGFSYLLVRERDARTTTETLNRRLEAANAEIREHARRNEELAVSSERNRLAREIHDGLGHYLTALSLQIETLKLKADRQPERIQEQLTRAGALVHAALEDVRASVTSIRNEGESLPLQTRADAMAANADLKLTTRMVGEERRLSLTVEHTLFRALQEALTNVRKHALTPAAELLLDYSEGDFVRLEVRSAGAPNSADGRGFGLNGVRERVEMLGGKMETLSCLDHFTLKLEIPT